MENLPDLIVFGLLHVVLPVWMLAGLADFGCHRMMRIEHDTGTGESLLHLLMLAELGVATLAALLLELTAAVFALMLLACLAHEVTTCVDLAYASRRRRVPWVEQWVHGLQQALPWAWLAGWMLAAAPQALALVGAGTSPPDWGLRGKASPLPPSHLLAIVAGAALLVWGPFLYECWRCRQASTGRQGGRERGGHADPDSPAGAVAPAGNRAAGAALQEPRAARAHASPRPG